MKTRLTHPDRKITRRTLLKGLSLSTVAALAGTRSARAQSPPPEQPDVLPPREVLPTAFQPSVYQPGDMTQLGRARFVPKTGGPKWPAVLLVHPGGFHSGDIYGPQGLRNAAKDLNAAGYLVFSVEYRLAPPETIPGQTEHDLDPLSGRPPQQTNDLKQQVLAARAHFQCNGKVFVVGGSAGGAHGFWVALDPAPTVPGWSSTTLVKAAVGLSGAYKFSEREGYPADPDVLHFVQNIINYTNTAESDYTAQYAVSPVALVTSSVIKPLYLITSQFDPMPPKQWQDMLDTLAQHGVPTNLYQSLKIDNNGQHAFDYWRSADSHGSYINQDVINFLNAHLNDP